ncbi:MAG TPA: glucose-6-phosphate dehydrogenase [Ktedonobacterales bacterium]|jgi:glucose-6-phosphate 1-dehydrogenase
MSESTLLTNPLRQGTRGQRTPQPCAMVIFGATGDLTKRKLLPALYNLAMENPLPAGFTVVGVARRPMTDEAWRQYVKDAINEFSRNHPVNPTVWESFCQGLFYHQTEFHDVEGYVRLGQKLHQLDHQRGISGNHIFYLATSPEYYPEIIQHLGQARLVHKNGHNLGAPHRGRSHAAQDGLNNGDDEESANGWTRVIIEKPFGHDLASAKELNRKVLRVFSEDQVYRIDHYLGKETVQNILVFRFSNGIFEPIWNRRYIDNVQITVAEQVGVEGRAGYYETAGAIRDMVQNHMMQLLSLTAMEPPVGFEANAVRDEKVKVLHAIPPLDLVQVARNTVRAQYGPGWINGKQVPGYYQEPGVAPDTKTETYIALKLEIDNWRWADVPFYLRTGKRLAKRVTQIDIEFKRPPFMLFKNTNVTELQPNVLSLRIQPNEGISLRFGAKVPGGAMRIRGVNMDFLYGSAFASEAPEAYERLLLDCMLGDSTLFTRRDETEAAWTIINSVLEGWAGQSTTHLPLYEAGSWGPKEADTLIERGGKNWRRP